MPSTAPTTTPSSNPSRSPSADGQLLGVSVVYEGVDLVEFNLEQQRAILSGTVAGMLQSLDANEQDVNSASLFSGSIVVSICFNPSVPFTSLEEAANNITFGTSPLFTVNITGGQTERLLTPTSAALLTACSASPTAAPTSFPSAIPTQTPLLCISADPFTCGELNASLDCADTSLRAVCPLLCGDCINDPQSTTTAAPTPGNVVFEVDPRDNGDDNSLWWLGFAVTGVLLLILLILLLCCRKKQGQKTKLAVLNTDTEENQTPRVRRLSDEFMDDDVMPAAGKTSLDGELPVVDKGSEADTLWDHYEMEHALFRAERQRRMSEVSLVHAHDPDTALETTLRRATEPNLNEPTGFFETAPDVAAVSATLTGSEGSLCDERSQDSQESGTSTIRRGSSGAELVMRYFSSHADNPDILETELKTELGFDADAFIETDSSMNATPRETPTPVHSPLTPHRIVKIPMPDSSTSTV